MSSPVTIYTGPACGFCMAAKRLLDDKGVAYQEINLAHESPQVREELMAKTNHRTIPQIFINDHFIGGYQELYGLNSSGEFDTMLADAQANHQD